MGQIVKRKKKGRPSKADLARRASEGEPPGAAAPEKDVRRSLRRRNVRYMFDFDDFDDLDEEEEEEAEDERRRQKKLKLLLKLQGKEGGAESEPSRTRRVDHAPPASPSSSDSGEKPPKKRRIDGGDAIDADADENDVKNGEIRGTKSGSKGADSVPGTPSEPPLGLPLHDKKTLELILDKLQKKDTYGVYAEPVDPEELPDYHDVIEHPMDFATVRKKLGNGSYSTLEQFEMLLHPKHRLVFPGIVSSNDATGLSLKSDVILICTNAMQYNAPDTIYHKQARSIQELAKKKFQRLRVDTEPYEKELKTDQKTRSSSYGKKQIKKPMNRVTQEPVGSDFSSGAALATAAEFQSASNATHIGGLERLTNVDGPIEGNTSQIDNNLDKPEDLQARGLLSRFGRKPFLHDENRRATYNNSDQPVVGSESIFTTFEGEIKQLVTVGLHSDHSYARSLARFAATLGPVAWKVASRRIEQALPPGFKFGRGWVGDYEPLPTPILVLENCSQKEPAFLTKSSHTSDVRKDDKSTKAPGPVQEHNSFPALEGNSSLFDAAVTKSTVTATASNPVPAKEQSVRRTILEGKQPFFGSGGSKPTMAGSPNYQQQSPRSRNNGPERKVVKQVELNYLPTSTNQNMNNLVAEKQIPNGLDVPASRSMETVSRNRNIVQSSSFKHPENKGLVAGGLPNGKVASNNLDRHRMVVSSSDTNPLATPATYFPHGQEQGLSDPVHLMRMMAENAQKQQKSSNNSPVGSPSVIPTSGPSSRRDDSNNAAAAAARAWMSIGAGGSKVTSENMSTHANQISADSLYNPARDLQPQVSRFRGDFPPDGMHFQPAKNSFPLQPFGAPPVRMEFQNRPVLFPQIVTADLSRFQVQPPWQGPSPKRQPKEKQESHPPDLNIGFQSSGSPVRQSSGVLVDSQQPDLALQL